jgi:hypothetical protein
MDAPVVLIVYDKYNRTFKLLDKSFGSLLEDGAVYELMPVADGSNAHNSNDERL